MNKIISIVIIIIITGIIVTVMSGIIKMRNETIKEINRNIDRLNEENANLEKQWGKCSDDYLALNNEFRYLLTVANLSICLNETLPNGDIYFYANESKGCYMQ